MARWLRVLQREHYDATLHDAFPRPLVLTPDGPSAKAHHRAQPASALHAEPRADLGDGRGDRPSRRGSSLVVAGVLYGSSVPGDCRCAGAPAASSGRGDCAPRRARRGVRLVVIAGARRLRAATVPGRGRDGARRPARPRRRDAGLEAQRRATSARVRRPGSRAPGGGAPPCRGDHRLVRQDLDEELPRARCSDPTRGVVARRAASTIARGSRARSTRTWPTVRGSLSPRWARTARARYVSSDVVVRARDRRRHRHRAGAPRAHEDARGHRGAKREITERASDGRAQHGRPALGRVARVDLRAQGKRVVTAGFGDEWTPTSASVARGRSLDEHLVEDVIADASTRWWACSRRTWRARSAAALELGVDRGRLLARRCTDRAAGRQPAERRDLAAGVVVVDDTFNANPASAASPR